MNINGDNILKKYIIFLVFVFLFFSPLVSASDWWNENWEFRKNVTFTERSGNNLTNYPVNYWFEHKGKANNDCSDIRILNDKGKEIEFGLKNCNSTHVRLANYLNVSENSSVDYTIYYGNPDASFVNNSFESFNDRYDSFEDGSFMNPNWNKIKEANSTTIIDNVTAFDGNKSVKIFSRDIGKTEYRYDMNNVVEDGDIFKASVKVNNIPDCSRAVFGLTDGNNSAGMFLYHFGRVYYYTSKTGQTYEYLYNLGEWHTFEIHINKTEGKVKFYLKDAARNKIMRGIKPAYLGYDKVFYRVKNTYRNCGSGKESFNAWFDNMTFTRYVLPSPSISIQSQQKLKKLKMDIRSVSDEVYSGGSLEVEVNVSYDDKALENLTKQEFEFEIGSLKDPVLYGDILNHEDISDYFESLLEVKFEDSKNYTPDYLENLGNGSYRLGLGYDSEFIEKKGLKVRLNYKNKTIEKPGNFNFLVRPDNFVVVTDEKWKNILSFTGVKEPVIVSKGLDGRVKHIKKFIKNYGPDQVFYLGDFSDKFLDEMFEPSFKQYLIEDRDWVIKLFPGEGIYVDTLEKALAASGFGEPLVFDKSLADRDLSPYTPDTIRQIYLNELDFGENIDYLVVGSSPYAGIVNSKKGGLVVQNQSSDVKNLRDKLNDTVEQLDQRGLYLENYENVLNGSYVLLLGAPPLKLEDPVDEQFRISEEHKDINKKEYTADIFYGDFNGDYMVEAGVGRMPSDMELASLMFSRNRKDNKKASVLAEYKSEDFLGTLLSKAGGVGSGIRTKYVLEDEGYDIEFLTERRANMTAFVENMEDVPGIVKSISSFFSNIKSMNIFGLLQNLHDLAGFEKALLETNEETINWDKTDKIIEEGFGIFWGDPYPTLNKTNILENKDSSILAYHGVSNGSAWILPTLSRPEVSTDEWEDYYLSDQYNGSKTIKPFENKARIIWDNSNYPTPYKSFIEKGSLSYIHPSEISYNPYKNRLENKFFLKGGTIGQGMKSAFNDIVENKIEDGVFNWVTNGSQREKTLAEFVLYGDPEMKKDPVEKAENFEKTCTETCKIRLNIKPEYQVENGTIKFDAEDYFMEDYKPLIPIHKFDYYLPETSELLDYNISTSTELYENISVPIIRPHSYGVNISNKTYEGVYPSSNYKLEIIPLAKRKKLNFIHALLSYNTETKEARVFKEINLTLEYETPVELSIPDDKLYGENLKVRLKNNLDKRVNGTFIYEIENRSKMNVSLKPKQSKIMSIEPPDHDFTVKAYFFSDEFFVGPRTKMIEVEHPDFISQTVSRITRVFKDFAKTLVQTFTPEKRVEKETTPSSEATVKTKNGTKIYKLETNDYKLKITNFGDKEIIDFKSSEGSLRIEKYMGKEQRVVNGDEEKLEKQFEDAMKKLKSSDVM